MYIDIYRHIYIFISLYSNIEIDALQDEHASLRSRLMTSGLRCLYIYLNMYLCIFVHIVISICLNMYLFFYIGLTSYPEFSVCSCPLCICTVCESIYTYIYSIYIYSQIYVYINISKYRYIFICTEYASLRFRLMTSGPSGISQLAQVSMLIHIDIV